ncbi:TetR/AcrR family transcriptional regulator C-terminal domain-containing protein [Streptomyces wuyuanensis]|uniref:TetR/AcrR family transcriptional regulator C-terminal domain-containing protein n=1 Tax=Streptomyces wuyuanensis TaxID=1196353 RepID=UPI003796F48E
MGATKIDRARVADTALRLLNEVGLEGLTLRAIARELDVKAPALYWHFKDKQALLDEMATEMLRRMAAETAGPAPEDWRRGLADAMNALRSHLLRYRDGAKVYSGTHYTDTSYAEPMERHLRMLVDGGFTPRTAARAWFTAYSYTIGHVIEEQAMGPDPSALPDGADASAPAAPAAYDLGARATRLAGHPLAVAAGEELFTRHEPGFRAGLAAVVEGIAATLHPDGAKRGEGRP